ncbi:MAG TPA: methylmalonyl-CoA mutase family protein [Bacteroidota bacterium]
MEQRKPDALQRLREAYDAWYESVYLRAMQQRDQRFVTGSSDSVRPLYTGADTQGPEEELARLGFPGVYPFTRGIQPTMYRGKLWTMRQYAGFGTAAESNRRYRYLLEQGQMGLSVAFDLPTQIGYDSDAPAADGEVGKVGVAIDTLADMEMLLDGIPLDKVSTSMTINAPAAVLLAMYIAVAEGQGVARSSISGTIQNDILKEYIARGTYIFPPKPSMRLITDIFAYCAREVPLWNTISISGYHIREAGSTAAQEVGFTLADGVEYVGAALRAGLDVDAFAGRLSFFFNAHNDLLEEVAKYRAARRLWARIMKERFHARSERSMMLRFHAQTAGSTLTAQQIDNNIVRVTIQTLAAVLGGAQSLHTNSRDEALALPTEDAVRIALRTQQIVAHESGVTNTIDPLGGSFYVEALTDRIEQEAARYIETIDGMGGMIGAIETGYVQEEIQKAAYRYCREVETGERVVVGMNRYQTSGERPADTLKIDRKVQEDQIAFLRRVRERRDNTAVRGTLAALKSAAGGDANLMPPILAAVRTYASVGEICGALREVFGEYREKIII